MTFYKEIDWEFPFVPLYGSPIIIPTNTILWRGYDTSYAPVGTRFAYYSSKQIAQGYVKNSSRQLGQFVTTKPLKILDIRFMKTLLLRMIHTNFSDKYINEFASIMLSFGLCSLEHQIKLVHLRYKDVLQLNTEDSKILKKNISQLKSYYKPGNIIEQLGVRIAETTNDSYTMGFLQELFKGVVDGFISPRLYSPFHTEKQDNTMSPELILFDPKASGIEQLTDYPKSVTQITIQELVSINHNHIVVDNVKLNGKPTNIELEFYMSGGNIDGHYMDTVDTLLNSGNKNISDIYEKGRKAGKRWKRKSWTYSIETPTPSYQISPFTDLSIGI